jgi:hypothetical protein
MGMGFIGWIVLGTTTHFRRRENVYQSDCTIITATTLSRYAVRAVNH